MNYLFSGQIGKWLHFISPWYIFLLHSLKLKLRDYYSYNMGEKEVHAYFKGNKQYKIICIKMYYVIQSTLWGEIRP